MKTNINQLRMLAWFSRRPSCWRHTAALAKRKFLPDYDTPDLREKATQRCEIEAIPYPHALKKLGIEGVTVGLDEGLINEGKARAARAKVHMGGAGDVDFLYDIVSLTKSRKVIETGVAYGWSSLAILHGLHTNGGGKLLSVDMPYPNRGNEKFVGIAVPDRYRPEWVIIREPDRPGLLKAVRQSGGEVDICHYDSDKSWWGRAYGFPLMWDALRPGGVFIADDIQDNFFFYQFAEAKSLPFVVTQSQGKYIGLLCKP